MTKTFQAHFPAKTNQFTGRTFPAETITFVELPNGGWKDNEGFTMFADEVAARCRKATNWREIKAAYFPMDGFHGDENWQDNTPSHKSDL